MNFKSIRFSELTQPQIWVLCETQKSLAEGSELPFDDSYKEGGEWTKQSFLQYIQHCEQVSNFEGVNSVKIAAFASIRTMDKITQYFSGYYNERSK